jgi:hypothetical protein
LARGFILAHTPHRGASGNRANADWVFWAFVVLATCAFGYKGMARFRVRAAEDEATICLAQRDAACTTTSIERGRAFSSTKEPRLDIASAGLAVLTGNLDQAARATGQAKALPDLDAITRGELLLVEGDLAEARGEYKAARDDWTAARPLVNDESLVTLRLSRAGRSEEHRAQSLSAELAALATAFDDLFALALTALPDRLSVRVSDLKDRLRHLPESDGRAKLLRAVDVAVQAGGAAARKRASLAYDPFSAMMPPAPPSEPSPDALRFDPRVRERQLADYRAKLAQYETLKKASEDRKAQGETDALSAARAMLEEGTRLVHDGLSALAPATTDHPRASQ